MVMVTNQNCYVKSVTDVKWHMYYVLYPFIKQFPTSGVMIKVQG